MSVPVDVLAVMDGAAEKVRFLAEKAGISHPANDLVEARAAAAELIEAAKHAREALAESKSDPPTVGKITRALARVCTK